MPEPASRRRRPPSPKPARGGGSGGGPLPTAALAIGVVVAGLGIGALVSAFQNRGTLPELGATSAPAVTPVAHDTPAPLGTLPPLPSPSPSPSAAATRTPAPSPKPSLKSSPAATATPTLGPVLAPTFAPLPSPSALASASPTARPTAAPKPPPTVAPPVASAVPVRTATPGDPSIALVRRYLQSLIAGDESTAYAALGGDRGQSLKEEAFLDKDARITSLRVSRSDASGVTIDADIVSGRGTYVATFRVTSGPNGPTIAQHDYIKV